MDTPTGRKARKTPPTGRKARKTPPTGPLTARLMALERAFVPSGTVARSPEAGLMALERHFVSSGTGARAPLTKSRLRALEKELERTFKSPLQTRPPTSSLTARLLALERALDSPGSGASRITAPRLLALERAFVCPLQPPPRARSPSQQSEVFEAVRLFAKEYNRLPCATSKDLKEANLGKALKLYE